MVVSRPFQTKGSDAGAVITVQDISEWRAVETQAEQMREAFFSMIRHELRRPLLEVERFLGGLDKEAPVDGSEALAGARRSASHLAAMVDDMLSLARLERDPLAVCLQRRVSLQFLLAGSDLAFRARAAEARLRLEVCLPEEDVVFWGDERRLSQVVGNLLDNALKFSRPGGSVELAG